MTKRPTLGEALEAYLSLGRRRDPGPGTDDAELVQLVGEDAPALKRALDEILDVLTDVPATRRGESLERLGDLVAERAKREYPEFSPALCEEIARLATWRWK